MYAKDGSKYEGNWVDARMHGFGVRTFAPSSAYDRYEGNHVDGYPMGQGTLYWKNGERYVGEFEQFSLHGYGVRYNSDGLIMQHGFYIHDTYDGLALAA
jgi:hypothetical protein